jgi:hypothetical protein
MLIAPLQKASNSGLGIMLEAGAEPVGGGFFRYMVFFTHYLGRNLVGTFN